MEAAVPCYEYVTTRITLLANQEFELLVERVQYRSDFFLQVDFVSAVFGLRCCLLISGTELS